MAHCTNCGNQLAEGNKFCSVCGTPVPAPEPIPEAVPAAADPQPYYAPAVTAEPVISVKTKVLGFVGMGLSIGGLFFAVLGILYALIGMVEQGLGFAFAIAFGMFSMPLSIVGRILANKSREEGNLSNVCSVGSGVGLGGIFATGAMLFLGIINLMI
ncbi:MAG: zinc-ribbon domain-containing protein [Oscillospiraceae bacterium]|nr:zinc-ribbon domain-containing protein [Oscillospiraceae bacterium]